MQPQELIAWLDYGLPREKPALLKQYLGFFGLDKIPSPPFNSDTGAITVWQLDKVGDGKGNVLHRAWSPCQYPGTVDGLVAALEKHWLLAPPSEYPGLKETVVDGEDMFGERGEGADSKDEPFTCEDCDAVYSREGDLTNHVNKKHSEN